MTLEDILALATGRESEALEFKRTTGTRREAAATVCAMLNHRGGHVLFGVTPEGDVVGQQVSDRTMEEVILISLWGPIGVLLVADPGIFVSRRSTSAWARC